MVLHAVKILNYIWLVLWKCYLIDYNAKQSIKSLSTYVT